MSPLFTKLFSFFLFQQLSGVTQWATCWPEESSVCLTPQIGLPAPNPAALECPLGWPTATHSANWWKRLESVKSDRATKWRRYTPDVLCPAFRLDLQRQSLIISSHFGLNSKQLTVEYNLMHDLHFEDSQVTFNTCFWSLLSNRMVRNVNT